MHLAMFCILIMFSYSCIHIVENSHYVMGMTVIQHRYRNCSRSGQTAGTQRLQLQNYIAENWF